MRKKIIDHYCHKYENNNVTRKSKIFYSVIGFVWQNIIILAAVVMFSFLLDRHLPKITLSLHLRVILSFLLAIPVIYFIYAYIQKLHKTGKGTIIPLLCPPKKLVVDGVYSICRNPMQFGYIIYFILLGIAFSSFFILAVALPLVIICLVVYVKMIEEKVLEKQFGKDYLKYKKEVPFIIPRIKGKKRKVYKAVILL